MELHNPHYKQRLIYGRAHSSSLTLLLLLRVFVSDRNGD